MSKIFNNLDLRLLRMPLHRRVNSPTLAVVVARNLVPQQVPAIRRFALHEPRTTVDTRDSTANRRQRPDGPIVHGVSVILTATPIRDQTLSRKQRSSTEA